MFVLVFRLPSVFRLRGEKLIQRVNVKGRDLRSFEIRFEFESDVTIPFDSKVTRRFENFEISNHTQLYSPFEKAAQLYAPATFAVVP